MFQRRVSKLRSLFEDPPEPGTERRLQGTVSHPRVQNSNKDQPVQIIANEPLCSIRSCTTSKSHEVFPRSPFICVKEVFDVLWALVPRKSGK